MSRRRQRGPTARSAGLSAPPARSATRCRVLETQESEDQFARALARARLYPRPVRPILGGGEGKKRRPSVSAGKWGASRSRRQESLTPPILRCSKTPSPAVREGECRGDARDGRGTRGVPKPAGRAPGGASARLDGA